MDFEAFHTFVFDFDGVILDSNRIKSEAFHSVALPFGRVAADALVSYHRANGGMSRFKKFDFFFKIILGRTKYERELEAALDHFGALCREGLLSCQEAPGLRPFLNQLPPTSNRIVVSGGLQEELRWVIELRGLTSFFDAVYGSPDTKEAIFRRELETGQIRLPFLMFGDSLLDFKAATGAGGSFLFLSGMTEFTDHVAFFKEFPNVCSVKFFIDLLPS
jgi:phosphoglycolate phosphatase-like HAD superfamily hydrolase